MSYEGLIAETVTILGHQGEAIEAYSARPLGPGPFPGVIVIHHGLGLDRWCKDVAIKMASHGYAALEPNLDFRAGPGEPDDVAARVRAAGWFADEQVMGDIEGALAHLRRQPYSNGKIGMIGFCSGGRYTYLAACRLKGLDAAVDCWGGDVVIDDKSKLDPKIRPVAPLDLTPKIECPILGLFGNEDGNPTPDQVNRTEEALQRAGKTYEFHRYDGAGHGFFAVERAAYRPEQAVDGWKKVFAFYNKHLSSPPPAV